MIKNRLHRILLSGIFIGLSGVPLKAASSDMKPVSISVVNLAPYRVTLGMLAERPNPRHVDLMRLFAGAITTYDKITKNKDLNNERFMIKLSAEKTEKEIKKEVRSSIVYDPRSFFIAQLYASASTPLKMCDTVRSFMGEQNFLSGSLELATIDDGGSIKIIPADTKEVKEMIARLYLEEKEKRCAALKSVPELDAFPPGIVLIIAHYDLPEVLLSQEEKKTAEEGDKK